MRHGTYRLPPRLCNCPVAVLCLSASLESPPRLFVPCNNFKEVTLKLAAASIPMPVAVCDKICQYTLPKAAVVRLHTALRWHIIHSHVKVESGRSNKHDQSNHQSMFQREGFLLQSIADGDHSAVDERHANAFRTANPIVPSRSGQHLCMREEQVSVHWPDSYCISFQSAVQAELEYAADKVPGRSGEDEQLTCAL